MVRVLLSAKALAVRLTHCETVIDPSDLPVLASSPALLSSRAPSTISHPRPPKPTLKLTLCSLAPPSHESSTSLPNTPSSLLKKLAQVPALSTPSTGLLLLPSAPSLAVFLTLDLASRAMASMR